MVSAKIKYEDTEKTVVEMTSLIQKISKIGTGTSTVHCE